jgi:predicted acyl esterase
MAVESGQDIGGPTEMASDTGGDSTCGSLPRLTRRKVLQAASAAVIAGANVGALAASSDPFEAARAAGRMGPRRIKEIETGWVEMPDGVRIAVRIVLPEDAESHPVPAIMEYIPYRRRDGTRTFDDSHFYYIASCGYACVRPDIRGSGDSDGILMDEYLQSEQDDGVTIIAWIAKQRWCTGRVGMLGISWGGFSALQVAACRPPALKAIITHCSTDDRYTDDAHYLGGAIVQDMFGWGSDFYTLQAFPPDPAIVGPRWRDMWKARCNAIDFSVARWVTHQTRDAFWKHASVSEDYGAITCPVYAIGGWADAYTNSIPRLMEHLNVPRKALIGPWGHTYPHQGEPGPAIDYLNHALRWWDYWLKGKPTGIMDEPMYRVWMQEDVAHSASQDVPGRWVAETTWPSPRITPRTFHLNAGSLDAEANKQSALLLSPAHQTIGTAAGHWCPGGDGGEGELPVELPLDQQTDDARSLVFDSAPLRERIEILGTASVELELSVDKPVALISVRLNEVHPGGTSRKMTYGVLNLTHRDSHEDPKPLQPGQRYRIRVPLKHAGFAFKPNHRIRVSISTAYWPLIWSMPEPVTLTLYSGVSTLTLPVRPPRPEDANLPPFGVAFVPPTSGMTQLKPAARPTKQFNWDVGTSVLTITSNYDGGAARLDAIGTVVSNRWEEVSKIQDADPTTARLRYTQSHEFSRADWSVRIETTIDVSCTRDNFILKGDVRTFDGDKPFFSNSWSKTITRQLA